MLSSTSILFLLAAASSLTSAADCNTGYTLCTPSGATSVTTPEVGDTAFLSLFVDIVDSSLPSSSSKRSPGQLINERGSASLCCVSSLSCLAMANLAIPFCYDRFTTNYFLPDGSYGTVVSGAYTSAGGTTCNLITGDCTVSRGIATNIYNNNESLKPNTSSLPMPSQFTGSGVGSAIPVTNLGSPVTLTYTTTLPGTTIPASTVGGSMAAKTVTTTLVTGGSTVMETSVASSSVPASTVPGTTLSAVTTVITTTSVGSVASASASTTKKSAGGRGAEVGVWGLVVMIGAWALL